ncbi:MAG: hypothetical protein QM612_02655 [Thermomonas sp.]|uniref:hypothetical protein n=1 Tax=Thermomonas sp. TaxID=1971895 RepID=UPI0039E517C2
MANITKGTQSQIPVFFNVDQRVGQGGTNQTEDVALVSYLMRLSAKAAIDQKAKQILQNVVVTTTCTPALIQSIKDLQTALKLTPDGRISPSTPDGRYSTGKYLIASLNVNVRRGYPDLWPRIDRITDVPTPGPVMQLVQRALVGIG